jgi:hypothetical protein
VVAIAGAAPRGAMQSHASFVPHIKRRSTIRANIATDRFV